MPVSLWLVKAIQEHNLIHPTVFDICIELLSIVSNKYKWESNAYLIIIIIYPVMPTDGMTEFGLKN